MKKVLFFVVAFVLMFQAAAFAQSKIGAISVERVLMTCDFGKALEASMKAKFEPMKKDLDKDAQELKQLEDELKNQDLALKLDAKQDKQREFRRKMRDYQDSVASFQQKLQTESQKGQQPIIEKILKVTNEYGKANGYTMIVEMRGVTLFIDDAADLTDQIVSEMNKLKKAGK